MKAYFEMLTQSFTSFKFSQRQNSVRSRADSQAKWFKSTRVPEVDFFAIIRVLLWPRSSASVDVRTYQNPDDGDQIGFWNANVFERLDTDVILRFYEFFWASVETMLSGLIQSEQEI